MDDLFDNPSSSGGVDDFDFDKAASAFPDIELDGDLPGPIPTGGVSANASAAELAAFAAPPLDSAPDVRVTGGDEIDAFEEQFPDIGGAVSPPPVVASQPTFGATPTFAPRPQPSAFATPILNQPIPDEEESEAVKEWREKQAEEIARRDAVSKEKREETKAKAEQAIDKFYEEYNSQKERTIRTNKQEELDYTTSLTDALSAGTTWSRICSLVELENSQSKSLARTGAGTTDLSRFKEVLLRLKRDGDSAPGAAGY